MIIGAPTAPRGRIVSRRRIISWSGWVVAVAVVAVWVRHLRGGFFALLIWRTAGTGCPPCLGNPQRGNRRRQGELGAGGGPEEFLRESQSRMGAPLRGAPRRRSAHDQPDPALVEGRHPGRRRGLSK